MPGIIVRTSREYAMFYNPFTNMCNDILNSECAKSTIEYRTKKIRHAEKFWRETMRPPNSFVIHLRNHTLLPLVALPTKKLYP